MDGGLELFEGVMEAGQVLSLRILLGQVLDGVQGDIGEAIRLGRPRREGEGEEEGEETLREGKWIWTGQGAVIGVCLLQDVVNPHLQEGDGGEIGVGGEEDVRVRVRGHPGLDRVHLQGEDVIKILVMYTSLVKRVGCLNFIF
jgi:hypothetical protein